MTTKCPICSRPTEPTVRPFCSRRCADVDLKRWLSEDYILPGDTPADFEDMEPGDLRH